MFTTMDYFQHQKSQKTEYYLEELEIEWRHFSKEKHEWKWKKNNTEFEGIQCSVSLSKIYEHGTRV